MNAEPNPAGQQVPTAGPPEALTYEQALELFDSRLRALEEGNLSLEEAITAVEEGRRYLKVCEAKLETARHKIEVRPEPGQAPDAEVAAREMRQEIGQEIGEGRLL